MRERVLRPDLARCITPSAAPPLRRGRRAGSGGHPRVAPCKLTSQVRVVVRARLSWTVGWWCGHTYLIRVTATPCCMQARPPAQPPRPQSAVVTNVALAGRAALLLAAHTFSARWVALAHHNSRPAPCDPKVLVHAAPAALRSAAPRTYDQRPLRRFTTWKRRGCSRAELLLPARGRRLPLSQGRSEAEAAPSAAAAGSGAQSPRCAGAHTHQRTRRACAPPCAPSHHRDRRGGTPHTPGSLAPHHSNRPDP